MSRRRFLYLYRHTHIYTNVPSKLSFVLFRGTASFSCVLCWLLTLLLAAFYRAEEGENGGCTHSKHFTYNYAFVFELANVHFIVIYCLIFRIQIKPSDLVNSKHCYNLCVCVVPGPGVPWGESELFLSSAHGVLFTRVTAGFISDLHSTILL